METKEGEAEERKCLLREILSAVSWVAKLLNGREGYSKFLEGVDVALPTNSSSTWRVVACSHHSLEPVPGHG